MTRKTCPQCGEEYDWDQKFCSRDGAALPAPAEVDSLLGQVVAGRYQVIRRLGEGGMGQVYLAEHLRMKRKCALKVMRPQLAGDTEAISRFNREATNASRIEHANVAAVFDFGDADDSGLIFLAMEYVDGDSLSAVLDQYQTLPLDRVATIISQVADALQAAHDQGITHRDLKPDNIMIKRTRSGDDMVKLVDFGISKVGDRGSQKVTVSGAIIGTPAYMSPEQVRAEPLDARSDVFSLGIVAFKMLTGTFPFAGEGGIESLAARLSDKPRRLADARSDVRWTPRIEAVMAKVLASDRANRYASAPEFAHDLASAVRMITPPIAGEAAAEDETTVRLTQPASQLPRSTTRRRLMAGVGVVVITAIAAVAIKAFGSGGVPADTARQQGTTAAPASVGADSAAPRGAAPTPPSSRPTEGTAPTAGITANERAGATKSAVHFAVPTLRVGVAGLAAAARAVVAKAIAKLPNVRLVDDDKGADLVVRANAGAFTVTEPGARLPGATFDSASAREGLKLRIRHASAMAQLATLDAPGAGDNLTFTFASTKSDFREGDTIRVRVRSARPGYLTLLDVGADGAMTLLMPSNLLRARQLTAGTEVTVPGPDDDNIVATLPPGSGMIRAIVTTTPLAIGAIGALPSSLDDPALITKVRRALERALENGSAQWSTRVLPYSIRAR